MPTNNFKHCQKAYSLPWEQGVAGSIPVSPTRQFKHLQLIL
jgi:hypothetical protein